MKSIPKVLLVLASLVCGCTFLYSAWTKVLPIQPFEYTMVEYLHFPWLLAAVVARLMVGLETALGGLMVLHLFGKGKYVLKTALMLLVAFSIYLVWLWTTAGNDVNCGCFGDAIWMSPAASLVKNAVLAVLIIVLIKWHRGVEFRQNNIATNSLFAIGVVLPFILFPISRQQPSWLKKDSYKLDFAPLYRPIVDDSDALKVPYPKVPPIDVEHGKHVIAFLSPSCEHCHIAARKMALMKRGDTTLPFFMIIGGIASDLTDFWKYTNAKNIPYMRLHRDPFLNYTGGVFPQILWVNDGQVEAKSTYNTLNETELKKWVEDK